MTYEQAINEPAEQIELAFYVWSLETTRSKLESERRAFEQSSSGDRARKPLGGHQ